MTGWQDDCTSCKCWSQSLPPSSDFWSPESESGKKKITWAISMMHANLQLMRYQTTWMVCRMNWLWPFPCALQKCDCFMFQSESISVLWVFMRHCGRAVGRRTPLGSMPIVRGRENLTGAPGEASRHICGVERITDQVITLWSKLNLILSSSSHQQEQKAFYWLKLTSSAVTLD